MISLIIIEHYGSLEILEEEAGSPTNLVFGLCDYSFIAVPT